MANKHLHVGPGGRDCVCCFPAPRSKDRRAEFRRSKRRAEREAMREAWADIDDAQEAAHELAMMEFDQAGYGDEPWDWEERYYDELFDPDPPALDEPFDYEDYAHEYDWEY